MTAEVYMPKDYYLTLGVSKGANFNKIKKAYRKIVKEVHPDITRSSESVRRFLEIRKAYETLVDEEKRRRYDQEQEKQTSNIRVKRSSVVIKQRPSVFSELENLFTPADEFFEGFLPGFFDMERGRIEGKDLYFEAILSSGEARRGGLFPISVPVHERCSRCRGTGYAEGFFCLSCSGYGMVDSERVFSLNMPPNVKHGTEITLSMEDIGLRAVYLHVRVLIDLYA
jgi:molecular chaperone DnaJ